MSQYDGCYVKLAHDPAYWAVDDGEKKQVAGPDEMQTIGIRPIIVVSVKELKDIPLAGQKSRVTTQKKK